MTNEIKEILDEMKESSEHKYINPFELGDNDCKILLNYITNLQQRIDKAVEYIKWNLDKNEELIEYFNYDANFNKLLNILRGDE